jgi:hypothetical protein
MDYIVDIGGVVRDAPFRACQMTCYEQAKRVYLRFRKSRMPRHWFFGSSDISSTELCVAEPAIVGGIADSVVVDNGICGFIDYGRIFSHPTPCLNSLFLGPVPRLAYVAPTVAIFFIAYQLTQ